MLLKRRPGMSFEEFVAYYESTHAKLGVRALPTAQRYFRRFLTPYPDASIETDVDVITEIWFKDRATLDAAMAHLQDQVLAQEIAADEERLFDRSKMRFFVVDERESVLSDGSE